MRVACERVLKSPQAIEDNQYSNESVNASFLYLFQAEDGMRDIVVTGVQTCALPIFRPTGPAPGGHCPTNVSGIRGHGFTFRKDRKSVVEGKSVDLGGRRIIKKK